MRAVIVHVMPDAAVSVLVILGLLLARVFGWLFMDPLAGIVGNLRYRQLTPRPDPRHGRDPARHQPRPGMAGKLRQAIEGRGDQIADPHLWRLGPGHLGAIDSVITERAREADYYRSRLARFASLSHLTVEVTHKR
jgi:Co/Zn/Cd efflux system component